MVQVVPGKKKGVATLGGISKPPVKMPNVPNPYLKKRVGVGKFVVPKSTIPPLRPAQGLQTAGIPSQKKPPTANKSTGEAGLSTKKDKNCHITRKKLGKIYNPASESMTAPPQITTEEGANLPGHTLTRCNHKLRTVYGDHIHHNDVTHLTGGIAEDALWKTWWLIISNLTPRFYYAPKGKVVRLFVKILTEELRGDREQRWNSKRPMVFIGTVLAKTPGFKNSKDIRARLLSRMEHWTDGHIGALIEDTCGAGKSRGACAGAISERDKEESAVMTYNRKVKAGHIRAAVRQATNLEKGGVLHANSTDPKTGIIVLDVLRYNHPALQELDLSHPECSVFEDYPEQPTLLPLDITAHKIEETVRKMGGSGGPSVTDLMMLKDWCTRFSAESESLREDLAAWKRWLANGSPPWAVYRSLMTGGLVALDKCPGVRPFGVGEAIQRLMENLVHTETTFQYMEAFGSHNLCARLKSGIKGAVHTSKRTFGRNNYSNPVSSDSHPKGANGLKTVWEGGSKPEDSKEEEKEVKALLTQPPPHWQGDRETNDGENSTEE